MRLFFLIFFFASFCFAQKKPSYQAQITAEVADIYQSADFDSKVIATVLEGEVYDVSSKTFNGAFYRIRVKPGMIGYISDADIKPLFSSPSKPGKAKNKKKPAPQAKEKKQRSFERTRYGGLQYASIEYQEDTMGSKRKERMNFFGVKLSGPDWMIDGYPMDINFLFSFGPPKYYEKITGHSADGFIFLMDFLFQHYYPQTKDMFSFFGFGPMFKFSRINASLTDAGTGRTTDYSLQDMSLGAAFNGGAAFRLGSVVLRGEAKLYWEKQIYWGVQASGQFNF